MYVLMITLKCLTVYDNYDDIIAQLTQLIIGGKTIIVMKNIYWKQTAEMCGDYETNTCHYIKRRVRQGCLLTLDDV